MFRTFLTCIVLMTAITAMTAGALARADTKSNVTVATGVRAKSPAGADNSTPVPHARTSKGVREGAAKTGKTRQADAQPSGAVKLSGMSVLGNQDAPKSLVLVPWKSAQIGRMPGLSMLLDDSIRPVDKDVFMRELAYYQIKMDAK